MQATGPIPKPTSLSDDFSLVFGGAVYRLFMRFHLAGDAMHLLYRRMAVVTGLAWLPLLILVLLHPAAGSFDRFSFVRDVEVHARLLVALPALLAAEMVVHLRLGPVVRYFLERHLIRPEEQARFEDALASAIRLRNSIWIELALLFTVCSVGFLVWDRRPVSPANWVDLGAGRWDLTLAGYWYVFFSIPVFQFILIRWYFRLFIWFHFLLQVSRMNLHLKPAYPDRAGGLDFLSKSTYAFGPILFAQGAVCAGLIASRVIQSGESLLIFKQQFFGFLIFFLLTILVPLLMFSPVMLRTKREGLKRYGLLAHRYVDDFENKWIYKDSQSRQVLGTADIQSLADLSNAYQIVAEMRLVPFKLKDVFRLSASFIAPFFPLLLTVFSLEQLLSHILRLLF